MSIDTSCTRAVPPALLAVAALAAGLTSCESQAPEPGDETAAERRSEATALSEAPVMAEFVPYDVTPELQNSEEVGKRLQELYPDSLEDAGIGGSVVLSLKVDQEGRVRESLIETSSGREVLDMAASRIIGDMEFSPAMNRGERVGVWVQQRIRFEPDAAGN
ncbi:MAG: energy transducer TonB [Candidatus Palauibacterales bacterium]|nr:energy transducer TonB [Candidatus Palauibacterales bacterium]